MAEQTIKANINQITVSVPITLAINYTDSDPDFVGQTVEQFVQTKLDEWLATQDLSTSVDVLDFNLDDAVIN